MSLYFAGVCVCVCLVSNLKAVGVEIAVGGCFKTTLNVRTNSECVGECKFAISLIKIIGRR